MFHTGRNFIIVVVLLAVVIALSTTQVGQTVTASIITTMKSVGASLFGR